MTDLVLAVAQPIAAAVSADTSAILQGEALRRIVRERMEQVTKHGFGLEHDRSHEPHELLQAANAYVAAAIDMLEAGHPPERAAANNDGAWPWERELFRPRAPIEAVTIAAALTWAALDRMIFASPDFSPPEVSNV